MKKIIKWIENFWYHYKYPFLLCLLALVTVVVALASRGKPERTDVYVTYAGTHSCSESELAAAQQVLSSALPEDMTGEGEKFVSFSSIYYLTRDEIRAKLEEDPSFTVLDGLLKSNLETYKREMEAGDSVIWFVSPSMYAEFEDTDYWMSMLEVIDSMPQPDWVNDQFSLKLLQTDFGKEYFSFLPEDTLLCIRRVTGTMTLSSREEEYRLAYDRGKSLFRAIVAYRSAAD